MKYTVRGIGALVAIFASACQTLDIKNSNEPNATSALADPASIERVAAGSLRTWLNAWGPLRVAATMSAQARTYSASWNNGNMNLYSGVDVGANDETTNPDTWTRNLRGWQNDPSAAGRTSVEAYWAGGLDESAISRPGVYAALSAANDALAAIRNAGIVIRNTSDTKRAETMAVFVQGASLMMISLNYDKGYYANEDSDLLTLAYSDRKAMRDSAVARLNEAYALAVANTFTTDPGWSNGYAYSNTQIAQIAKTMVAMTLAWYPRDDTEAGTQVNWASVATAASLGVSTGTPVTLQFNMDGCSAWCDETLVWMNSFDTARIWTRLAHLLDPATQKDPYPLTAGGNTQPNSADKRLGDGSWGPNDPDFIDAMGNVPKTAQGGTDFAYSDYGEVFRPDRGFYHQSNLAQIKFDLTGDQGPTGVYYAKGPAPIITPELNDLIWAEALMRQGGVPNLTQAATLINKTRVTRGGLSSAAGFIATPGTPNDGPCMSTGVLAKDGGACTLWSLLLYENEIELLGLGAAPFWNHRHLPVLTGGGAFDGSRVRYIQGLIPGTPREMPVPAKELGVKNEALYSYGGAGAAKSTPP